MTTHDTKEFNRVTQWILELSRARPGILMRTYMYNIAVFAATYEHRAVCTYTNGYHQINTLNRVNIKMCDNSFSQVGRCLSTLSHLNA